MYIDRNFLGSHEMIHSRPSPVNDQLYLEPADLPSGLLTSRGGQYDYMVDVAQPSLYEPTVSRIPDGPFPRFTEFGEKAA